MNTTDIIQRWTTYCLSRGLGDVYKRQIPEKEMITKKWITPETLSLVQEKRILKKKKNSTELADREYRQKCNEVQKAARADKAKWLERQCENIEKDYGKYKTREVYQMIGDINRKWQPKQTAIRDSNG